MGEAGRFFERMLFGSELAIFVKAANEQSWCEQSPITGNYL
jgi:hypothetical protein